tara:strand:+ start:43345 stop:43731 length:387 start_codon:yes stop_codon:yes gene_type:complete
MRTAVFARKGLGYGVNTFPQGSPSRRLLDASRVFETNSRRKKWFCQAFISGERYAGHLDHDICFYRIVPEVRRHMSSKKMMQIRISSDLHKWLKLHAAQNETTMTTIIINYLERMRQKSQKKVKVDQI